MSNEQPFTPIQKEYLSGFFAGMSQRGSATSGEAGEPTVYGTPIEDLCKEEGFKYEKHGLDCYEDLKKAVAENRLPEGADMFRFKFYGLFNVSPAQESFMLRCRIAGGFMRSYQMDGFAEMAEEWAGGFADVTTRANLQLRQIEPKNAINCLEKLVDIGLTSRGSGADNLRNITASATAGIDPHEIYDVRPLAKAMHHYILNTRIMYDLPRKFNISYDGGGAMSVCADTNDIAFYAVRIGEDVRFRVQLAGITGHKQFAKDSGIAIQPEQCQEVAAAMIKVFVENGDRTARGKARLKYLIDKWGTEKFLEETEKTLGWTFDRVPLGDCVTRRPVVRRAHLGVHAQVQEGLNYIGVLLPVGRLLPHQMRGLASIARRYGQDEIRLTVWQNLLIPHIRTEDLDAVKAAIIELGLHYEGDSFMSGLVACTGSLGCKYASANTKGNSMELGRYLAERHELDEPLNIHLTGCAHSCAQHYIGDIGMQATRVKVGGESVEGYSIVFGGGIDDTQGIAKEVFSSIPFTEVKPLISNVLTVYQRERAEGETFLDFNRRHDADQLRTLYALDAVSV